MYKMIGPFPFRAGDTFPPPARQTRLILVTFVMALAVCVLLWASTSLNVGAEGGRGGSAGGVVVPLPPPTIVARTAVVQGPDLSAMCTMVMGKLIASAPATEWPPPCPLPEAMRAAFEGPDRSMPNSRDYCQAQRYEGELVVDWNEAFVTKYCAGLAAGTATGSYRAVDDELVRRVLLSVPGMVGSTGMVLGSERPWVECFALNAGAATVWTFEYATVVSTHPRLKAKPCKIMAAEHVSGALPLVDWIATYSSLEHSGLGRYGDALNPDGDKEALLQALCMLKPGGILLLGLPTTCKPDGYLEFNSHRIYGFKRLAYITEGFELVRFAGPCVAPPTEIAANIIVLRKPSVGPAPMMLTSDDFQRAALLASGVSA
jgi:hypothetical protein